MKTAHLAGLGALLLCAAHAQSPIAHWSFDSTSSDYVVENGAGPKFDLIATHKKEAMKLVDGIQGKALGFTDTGSVIVISDSRGTLNFPQCTMEALIYYVPGPKHQSIIQNATFYPRVYMGYSFVIYADGRVSLNTGHPASFWTSTTASLPLEAGRAYHLAAVINQGGQDKLFIDGEPVGASASNPYLPNTGMGFFGMAYGDTEFSGWSKSTLDEVKIYDQALSDADILSHYQQYQGGLDSLNAAQ